MTLALFLEEVGCEVLGPAYNVEQGLDIVKARDFDAAIVDVNLGSGTTSAPIVDILRERCLPFFFATGYGADGLREIDRSVPRLQKPYTQQDLYRMLVGVCR